MAPQEVGRIIESPAPPISGDTPPVRRSLSTRFLRRIDAGEIRGRSLYQIALDKTQQRSTRRTAALFAGVSTLLALAGACDAGSLGGDAPVTDPGTPDGGTGGTPPPYNGPSDQCWTLYERALEQGSVPEADAQTLVDCGNQNPGYFQHHEMPVVSDTGETVGNVIFGDRPPH